MRLEAVTCSAGRPARVVRCSSGREAASILHRLHAAGAPPDQVVVAVRDGVFSQRRRSAWATVLPEVVAVVAGAVVGAALAGPWAGFATAVVAGLLVGALRTGNRGPADPTVRGARYELIAARQAVPVVDEVLGPVRAEP